MALKTTRWDSAEYLKTDADVTAYLDACFDEAPDDPAFLLHALGTIARAGNMSQLARDSGLTREGLYKALSSDGNPSFGTVMKAASAMGYRFALVRKGGQAGRKGGSATKGERIGLRVASRAPVRRTAARAKR